MKTLHVLVLWAFLPLAALAQTAPAPVLQTVPAAEAVMSEYLWVKRPIVVFADSPADPAFLRQMQMLEADPAALAERDVVVIVDTAPDPQSAVRRQLRPRGFSLVLMDKDGAVKLRNPRPWTIREITHAIDRFPLRRQEMLEQRPAGR